DRNVTGVQTCALPIYFIIPSAEQSHTLHHAILDFAKANNVELNIVQKADNILFNINSIGIGLGCTILPGYIVPLTMDNTVIRPQIGRASCRELETLQL